MASHQEEEEQENFDGFMDAALIEAESAVQAGNHPFGAVLVVDGSIVLRAQNAVLRVDEGDNFSDSTRHAEMELVSKASR